MGRQPTRGQVAGALAALAVLLGGGGGTAGYYLHETRPAAGAKPTTSDAFPMDRGAALEQWRAAQDALKERDKDEHAQLVGALKESVITNTSLREAVITLTERLGSTRADVAGLDARVRALESGSVRPASMRR